jgi:hypothetical protein
VVGSHAANTKWWLEHLEAVVKFCPLSCDSEIAGSSKTLINFYQAAHPTKHYRIFIVTAVKVTASKQNTNGDTFLAGG